MNSTSLKIAESSAKHKIIDFNYKIEQAELQNAKNYVKY